MKLKKIIKNCVCVSLAISVSVLAGCSTKSNDKKSDSGLPVITWLLPGNSQPDLAAVLSKINEYIGPKTGVALDLQIVDSGAYQEKIQMVMASGANFDICFTGYNNPYQSAVSKGAYLELDDYFNKSGLKDDADLKLVIDNARYNGKIYGIPNVQVLTNCTGLVFNKKLADEYGLKLDSITCLEDCEPYLEWVKTKHPEIYPFRTGSYGGGWSFSHMTDAIHGIKTDVSDTGELSLVGAADDKEALVEAKKLNEWYKKGYIRKDVASVTDDISEYNAGKYALSRSSYKPGGEEEDNMVNPEHPVYIKRVGEAWIPYDAGLAAMTAINKRSKNPDKAFAVLELANTDSTFINMLSYGIEGKHYELVDGKVKKKDATGYNISSWIFGNVFNAYLLQGQPDNMAEETRALHKEAGQSKIKGFAFVSDNVRTEIAQLETVKNEYKNIQKGAEDPDTYYDEYIAETEKAGESKLKAEIRLQFDKWKTSK